MQGVDLGSAVVLGLVLIGLVQLVMSVLDPTKRLVALVSLAVAIVAVQLVAASDFASEQVVLDRPLNSMNFASQLVVSLLAAGIASGVWQIGAKAVSNIGQNQEPPGA
jgi:hypothetical protein